MSAAHTSGMATSHPSRVARGVPTGGQFATGVRAEPTAVRLRAPLFQAPGEQAPSVADVLAPADPGQQARRSQSWTDMLISAEELPAHAATWSLEDRIEEWQEVTGGNLRDLAEQMSRSGRGVFVSPWDINRGDTVLTDDGPRRVLEVRSVGDIQTGEMTALVDLDDGTTIAAGQDVGLEIDILADRHFRCAFCGELVEDSPDEAISACRSCKDHYGHDWKRELE